MGLGTPAGTPAAAAATAAAADDTTTGVEGVLAVGEAAVVAEGVMGVVGTWEEPRRGAEAEVEVGVTAVEGLE